MEGTVNITDFMAHLRAEGLVIVQASELAEAQQMRTARKHHQLMNKPAITFAQAAEILGKSKNTIRNWVAQKRIKPTEILTRGKTQYVSTMAVKRLQGL